MIELMQGLPGSGKSYYAVSNKIVPWLKAGRRVFAVMDLVYSDLWLEFTGLDYKTLRENLVICQDMSFLQDLKENDSVVIDECQRFFRAGSNPDKDVLYWFETHRHKGLDVVLLTQDYMKILRQVYILSEVVYCFRKLSFLGLYNRTKCKVKAGVRDEDLIKTFTVKFEKKYCLLYRSYDNNNTVEGKNKTTSIFSSWVVRVSAVALIVIGYVIFGRPWLSSGKKIEIGGKRNGAFNPAVGSSGGSSGALPVSGSRSDGVFPVSPSYDGKVYQVTGSMGSPDGSDYTFLMCDGSIMSLNELKASVGASVWHKDSLHGWRLESEGVRYVVGCGTNKSNG